MPAVRKPIRPGGVYDVPLRELGPAFGRVIRTQHAADVKSLRKAAPGVLREIQTRASANIVERDKVYTGKLLHGWRIFRVDDGAELVNTAPYAGDVEGGRAPNLPVSYADILDWTYGKLVLRGDISPWEAESFAANVTKNIHRDGIPPTYIVSDAIDDVDERLIWTLLDEALPGPVTGDVQQ